MDNMTAAWSSWATAMKLGPQVVRRVIDPASLQTRSVELPMAPAAVVARAREFFRSIGYPCPASVVVDGMTYRLPTGELRSPGRVLTSGVVVSRSLIELRSGDRGDIGGGRVIPYNTWAPINGRYEEAMSRGVFARSIEQTTARGRSVPLMVAHRHQELPVGRVTTWDDRDDGLHARWAFADTDQAREVRTMVEDGYLSGLSVGFQPDAETWELRPAPLTPRVTRRQARLLEVSVCSVPTWEESTITRPGPSGTLRTPHLDRMRSWRNRLAA